MMVVAAWLVRDLLTAPRLWALLAAVLAAGVYLQRFTIDNHQYLMAYWCGGVALALSGDGALQALRRNARLLIGLAFAFATAWKLASPEFVSGSFLEYAMLTDQRFAGFTAWVADVPRHLLDANRAAIGDLSGPMASTTTVALNGSPLVSQIALAMTWYTLIIESWIALAFLLPRPRWLARHRDVPLLLFLLTTYAVATVIGFAYLLIAMGFVQCERRRWWIPCGYLIAVFALQIFLLPFGRIAAALGL
jgi:hypothetical protein